LGISIILIAGDWFGANKFVPWISNFLLAYFIISAGVTGWFIYARDKKVSSPISVSV
jgi:hypothetical protein